MQNSKREWKKIEARIFPEFNNANEKLAPALKRLIDYKDDSGRYLVTRKVHWQSIFRILVDRGIYPDGTDYRGFCCYIESIFPTTTCRVPLDYHSLKNISQTMFVRPFTEWHYDAVYDIKFKSYYQMYRIAALLDEQLSENQSRLIRLLEPCNKKIRAVRWNHRRALILGWGDKGN